MLYDLFVCHASEDKDSFVRPLAELLKSRHVEVWYDDFSLNVGDSIRQSIDKGIRESRFGVVILSRSFFAKKWPQYELDGLAEIEMCGKDPSILPVWHGVQHRDVMQFSPPLANRRAVSSAQGLDRVAEAILRVVSPKASPLIIARDILLDWGAEPPVVTDEYWLNVVEASNRVPASGGAVPEESVWASWSFPLPDKDGGPQAWGERLAWTAMQLNWTRAAEAIPISPISEPQVVLQFINGHPGLYETCEACPEWLAEYAPQLVIPGFGGDFEAVFDDLYQDSLKRHLQMRDEDSITGSGLTTSGKCPLCDEEWALRHPSFGEYDSTFIANAYFGGQFMGPPVSPFEHTEHAFWLLSGVSTWLPVPIRAFLQDGMAKWHVWVWSDGDWPSAGAVSKALSRGSGRCKFNWTKKMVDDFLHRAALAIHRLSLPETPEQLLERFLEAEYAQKNIAYRRKVEARRRA